MAKAENLEQLIKEVTDLQKESRRNLALGRANLSEAQEIFYQAEVLRRKQLQEALDRGGLAICDDRHIVTVKDEGRVSLRDLGVFPKGELKLWYYESGPTRVRGEYDDSYLYTRKLELLCPDDLPPQKFARRSKDYNIVSSTVLREGDKFILDFDGTDITSIVKKGGPSINPNGRRLDLVEDRIYRHFGIPDLPPMPTYDR